MKSDQILRWVERVTENASDIYHKHGGRDKKLEERWTMKQCVEGAMRQIGIDLHANQSHLRIIRRMSLRRLGRRGARVMRNRSDGPVFLSEVSQSAISKVSEPEPKKLFPEQVGRQLTLKF